MQAFLQPYIVSAPRRGLIGNSRYATRLRRQIVDASRDKSRCAGSRADCGTTHTVLRDELLPSAHPFRGTSRGTPCYATLLYLTLHLPHTPPPPPPTPARPLPAHPPPCPSGARS